MRKLLSIFLFFLAISISSYAQTFEGILQIDYRSESGSKNAIDVYVKGDKFCMQKLYGGCDRYNVYIYDTRTRILSCLSPQAPKTALSLDADKVMSIYEGKHLKPGYQVHTSHPYSATVSSKKIGDLHVMQKKRGRSGRQL